jgi:hypothetical protein
MNLSGKRILFVDGAVFIDIVDQLVAEDVAEIRVFDSNWKPARAA